MSKPKFLKKYFSEAGQGAICPICGSPNICAGQLDMECNEIYQNITCEDCEKSWTDKYTLTGITYNDIDYEK